MSRVVHPHRTSSNTSQRSALGQGSYFAYRAERSAKRDHQGQTVVAGPGCVAVTRPYQTSTSMFRREMSQRCDRRLENAVGPGGTERCGAGGDWTTARPRIWQSTSSRLSIINPCVILVRLRAERCTFICWARIETAFIPAMWPGDSACVPDEHSSTNRSTGVRTRTLGRRRTLCRDQRCVIVCCSKQRTGPRSVA
ncbi:hypothetical protein OBBRIDRAFT_296560 [Obba rivulosa]|uniref:Uncharacterized protein n=1 Tax=Obba rivulosa TaxID=1052685 RepID=A0A8E2DG52_9APHY|nr:hypothetical protein OBBRIDRAFT_296560 [Obba rivulosa]